MNAVRISSATSWMRPGSAPRSTRFSRWLTASAILVLCLAPGAEAVAASRDVRYFMDYYPLSGPQYPELPPNPAEGMNFNFPRAKLWKNLLTGEVSVGSPRGRGVYGFPWASADPPGEPLGTGSPFGVIFPLNGTATETVERSVRLRTRTGATVTYDTTTTSGAAISDRYTLRNIVRRTSLDGSEYEALPVTVERNGQLWLTHYLGYRMGRVAGQTTAAVPADQQESYDLVSLPEPIVEGLVTEYIYRPVVPNSPWGHFFYAASETERAQLDENEDWMRSGREFKSGGYLPVCRFFYRPANGGPATHFYTAKADECERFKTMPGFTYEGTPFRASLPRPQTSGQAADDPARCPEKTVPLWRYFNQANGSTVAPNHRYMLTRSVGDMMRSSLPGATPWAAEGIALCVPE